MLLKCKFCNCGKVFNEVDEDKAKKIVRVQCPDVECKVKYAKERGEIPAGHRVIYRTDGWGFVEPIQEKELN